MVENLSQLQALGRKLGSLDRAFSPDQEATIHPFDERNIHPEIAKCSQELFDNGHYSQATFEAFKLVDRVVSNVSGSGKSGTPLMMDVFKNKSPAIHLNKLANQSDEDEQEGYKFLFSGSMLAIRNPRGHEVGKTEHIEDCLDHLGLASMLLRRLDSREAP